MSQAAPYRHFDSKEALLVAVAIRGFAALDASIDRFVGSYNAGGLNGIVRGYVDFAADHPNCFRLMFSHEIADWSRYPDLTVAAHRTGRRFREVVGNSLPCGAGPRLDPAVTAVSAWAAVHGLAALVIDGPVRELICADRDAVVEMLYRLLEAGLAARAPEVRP